MAVAEVSDREVYIANVDLAEAMIESVKRDWVNPYAYEGETKIDADEIRRHIKNFLQSDLWEWVCELIDYLDPEVAAKALWKQLNIGPIKNAREIGKKGKNNYILKYCPECCTSEWARLVKGKARSVRCRKCQMLRARGMKN